ncbi:alpha/beta hydrolase [Micrococcales bacterium 31B]|nr:alpha/beta hydrolase [Micrococcales bacterium 31B]
MAAPDARITFEPGPWQHRWVSANGARFHAVDGAVDPASGEPTPDRERRPLVLLLHDFPQFWYTWRHALPVLQAAGFRPVAIDIRGYGASDKPPRGYDVVTLVDDISGIIRSLGYERAILVGCGLGGWLAWATALIRPECVRALAALGVTHPVYSARPLSRAYTWGGRLDLLRFALPGLPERSVRRGFLVRDTLTRWGGAGDLTWLEPRAVELYEKAMHLPAVDRSALGYLRWIVRSQVRGDMRAFIALARRTVDVPTLHVMGERDGLVSPAAARRSGRYMSGPYTFVALPGCGHFVPEQDPAAFHAVLLDWIATLPPAEPHVVG